MPALRVHAVVRTLTGLIAVLAVLAPSALASVAAPNAVDDSINAYPGGARDVLANDTDGGGGGLVVSANTQPANGTATCSELGACFYKANAGFTGSDSFTYTARNGAGESDTATVSVNVTASTAQSALAARDDDVATLQGKAIEIKPLANDSGPGIARTSNGNPKHGSLTCTGDTCTYQPEAGYTGSDGFTYQITDAAQRTASAAVHILVAPAGTAYGLDTTGGPNSVASGGQASWGLRVLGLPEGISGEELRALGLPSGSGSPSGPHALAGNALQFARGFSGQVGGDGKLNFTANDDALLGESRSQTFPRPLPPISQGTGGDGHVPILVGSKVFAFYHHNPVTSATCVDRATGAVCPGYPKRLQQPDGTGFGTTDVNGPGVVSGTKLWTHLLPASSYAQWAPIGLYCWDAATDSSCGLTIVDRVAQNGNPTASAPALAGGKMWMVANTGKLYCVDPASGATCGSYATGLATGRTQTFGFYFDIVTHGSRVFVSQRSDKVACFDTATTQPCTGWAQPKDFSGRANLVNQGDGSGNHIGVCVVSFSIGECVTDAAPDVRMPISNFVVRGDYYEVTQEAEAGRRTLVGSLDTVGLGCYDWGTMAPCTGGGYGQNGAPPGWVQRDDNGASLPARGAYGAVFDGSCAIALGDIGRVYTVDPAGSAPCVSLGSGTDRTTIDLRDQRCDRTVGAASWRDVRLSDTDASEMESVIVTVRDASTGAVLKSGEMIGGQPLDLSGISAAEHPALTFDATARSKGGNTAWDDGIPPRIRTTWKSDPQQVCAKSNADNACAASPATISVLGELRSGARDTAQLGLQRNPCSSGGVLGTTARSCTSRRRILMTLRIEKELRRLKAKESDVKSVRVTVNGKRARTFKRGGRWRARADLRRLRKGRYVVRITVTLKNGEQMTGVRRYYTCRDAIAGGPPRL